LRHNRLKKNTRATTLLASERRMKAFELRKKGYGYEQIGKALGISMQAAHHHVKTRLKELAKKTDEDAKQVLQLELARLDQMLLGLYEEAISGKESAVDRALKIMERRSKMLGIDAPTRPIDDPIDQPSAKSKIVFVVKDSEKEIKITHGKPELK